jgi:flagellar protein FlgJ
VALSTTGTSALDLQAFSALRASARQDRAGTAVLAARHFEALMLQTMVRSMRQATPGDPLFGSSGRVYRDLFDQQLALHLSESKSVGLADLLVSQLRRSGALDEAGSGPVPVDRAPPSRGLHRSVSGPRGADASAAEEAAARREEGADLLSPFASRADFVRRVEPHARRAAAALGVAPGILIAQAALESGWGRSMMRRDGGESAYNLFGIKAGRGWQGDVVTVPTLEYEGGVAVRREAAFRAYGSLAESFEDYAALIGGSPRYVGALARAADPRAYIQEIQAAGYATDPRYAEKVLRIWESELEGGRTLASL